MSKVMSRFAMSLDGFIAQPDDHVGPLFDRYFNGEVPVTQLRYRVTPADPPQG